MASTIEVSPSWTTLSGVIRRVRSRWRLRVALHGVTIVVGAAIVLLIGSAWLMNALHFNTPVIIALRVAAYAILIWLAVRYIVIPLRRQPTDPEIALYLEEHHPALNAVVLSAVDAQTHEAPYFVRSPSFVGRVVDTAVTRVRAMGNGTGIETRSITTSLATLAGMIVAVALLMMFGPEFMRTGAHLLAAPVSDAHGKVFIGVTPGDSKVSRGGDQAIRAQMHGFTAGSAELVTQRGTGAWERIPMGVLRDSGAFTIRLFDLRERTSYYVESEGIRSPTYHLDIVELPYVKALALELHYPAYTGLPVKAVAKGGDIAVLRGTTVRVNATTTIPVTQAWIVVDGKPKIPMTHNADGTWTGAMTVAGNGFYKIELAAPNGDAIPGSLNYTIDMLEDAPPTITFLKPGRDVGVDSLAEVFSQVEATDDYGVAQVQLYYTLNGGTEQVVSLQSGPSHTDVVAGYTFFLKSLNLKPGDVISYYAQATDNDTPKGGQVAKTDIYFIAVRPHYKYEKGKGGKGGQKNNDPNPGELVRKQRQIVAATFKVDRDRSRIAPQTLSENITTLSLSQNRLRNQVEQIGQKLMSRGMAAGDTMYQIVLDEITSAATEMKSAESSLAGQNIHPALGPEQRALQHLQRAESANRTRKIQQSQDPSQDQDQEQDEDMAKELANLFALDTGKLGKQVEMQRPMPKPPVDELTQKLKELAARQQREQELQKQAQQQAQQQGQPKSGDGGANQRQLAKDAEQMAKQLDQMAQQMGQQQMGQQQPGQQGGQTSQNEQQLRATAQQLRAAAQDMRRAATGQDAEDAAQAAAKLAAAQQMLAQQNQTDETGKDTPHKLLDRAHELMRAAQSLDDRLNQNPQGSQQGPDQQSDKQQPGQGKDRSTQQQSQQPGGEQNAQQQEAGKPQPGSSGNGAQQLSREFRDQRQAAEALQRDVEGEGGDTKSLEQVIKDMRALEGKGGEDKLAPQLQSSVVEGLKAWEFGFRRHLEGGDIPRPVLGGNNDVPAGYRALVDQYYQSLSKAR